MMKKGGRVWLCLGLVLLSFVLNVHVRQVHAATTWQDTWHDETGAKFGFRYNLTIINLLNENRTLVPVEVNLTFPEGQCYWTSLRVVREFNGSIYREVPFQNFSLVDSNSNGFLEAVTLRFPADLPNSTVDQGFGFGTAQYWVYWNYSATTPTPSYTYPSIQGPAITTFNDSATQKTVYFPQAGNQTVYVRIPKEGNITASNLTIQANYQLVESATLNIGGTRTHGVHIGDVDNDGLNEIIAGRDDGQVHFWDWNGTDYQLKPAYTEQGNYAYALFVADTNDNGTNDLLIGIQSGWGLVYEWLNFTSFWTTEGEVFANRFTSTNNVRAVYVGDSDNDSETEFVFAETGGPSPYNAWVCQWNGTGYEINYTITSVAPFGIDSVLIGDVDNLPGNELILAGSGTEIHKWNGTDYALNTFLTEGLGSLSVGDSDNDGLMELATGGGLDQQIYIYNWNVSGFLEIGNNISLPMDGNSYGVRIGDIDNDGLNELFIETI